MTEEKLLQQLYLSLKNADIITYQSNTKVNISIGRERLDEDWWDENPEKTEEDPIYGDVYINIHIPFYEKENSQLKYSISGLLFTISFSKLYDFYASIDIPNNDTVLTMNKFVCIDHKHRVNQKFDIAYNLNYTYDPNKFIVPYVTTTSKLFNIKSIKRFLDTLDMLKDVTIKRDYIDLTGQKHQDLITFSIDVDKIKEILYPIVKDANHLYTTFKNTYEKINGIL